MAQSASLQMVGLDKILKKLDAKKLTAPAQRVMFRELVVEGSVFLSGKLSTRYPRTASSINVAASEEQGKITAPRYPYVFAERGSQYPVSRQFAPGGGGTRQHRRRSGVRNSQLRQKPLRYLAQTKAQVRRNIPKAKDKAAREIEKDWAA